MKESVIQKHILDWLKAMGIFHWRNHQNGIRLRGGVRGKAHANGIADITGVLPSGRAFAIEVKAEEGRLSKSQETWREGFLAAGGVFVVARSVEQATEVIKNVWVDEVA